MDVDDVLTRQTVVGAQPSLGRHRLQARTGTLPFAQSGSPDSRPLRGTYPTNIWPVGLVVEDHHIVPVGQDAHRLVIGFYELQTMTRLTAWRDDGTRWAHDQVVIQVDHE